jgi:hypothetical protein
MDMIKGKTLELTVGFDDAVVAFAKGTLSDSAFMSAVETELVESVEGNFPRMRMWLKHGGTVAFIIKTPALERAFGAEAALRKEFPADTEGLSCVFEVDTTGCPPSKTIGCIRKTPHARRARSVGPDAKIVKTKISA